MFGERIRSLISKGRALGIRLHIFLVWTVMLTLFKWSRDHKDLSFTKKGEHIEKGEVLMGRGRKRVYSLLTT